MMADTSDHEVGMIITLRDDDDPIGQQYIRKKIHVEILEFRGYHKYHSGLLPGRQLRDAAVNTSPPCSPTPTEQGLNTEDIAPDRPSNAQTQPYKTPLKAHGNHRKKSRSEAVAAEQTEDAEYDLEPPAKVAKSTSPLIRANNHLDLRPPCKLTPGCTEGLQTFRACLRLATEYLAADGHITEAYLRVIDQNEVWEEYTLYALRLIVCHEEAWKKVSQGCSMMKYSHLAILCAERFGEDYINRGKVEKVYKDLLTPLIPK